MTAKEAHDFAEAIREMATGMEFTHYDPFYIAAFIKCADVIDELSTFPLVNNAERKENGEKGKEKIPLTPLRDKDQKREEKATPTTTARACARVFPPTFEQVESFAALNGITPAFAKYWFDIQDRINDWRHPKSGRKLTNWKRYLSLWWKRRDDFDPIPAAPKATPKPTVIRPTDWLTCAERCANFSCGKCLRGLAIPPVKSDHPHPPEECPRFHPRSV